MDFRTYSEIQNRKWKHCCISKSLKNWFVFWSYYHEGYQGRDCCIGWEIGPGGPSDSTILSIQYFPIAREWLIGNDPGIKQLLPEENDDESIGQNSSSCVSGGNQLKTVWGGNIRNSVARLNLTSSINAQIMWSEIFPNLLGQFSQSWIQSRADSHPAEA